MNFDNTYVLDKVIESLVLAIVAHLLIRFDYTSFLMLLVASFVTLILLDVMLGKVDYTSSLAPVINVKFPTTGALKDVAAAATGKVESEQKGGTLTLPNAAPIARTPVPDATYFDNDCQSCSPTRRVRRCGQPKRGTIPTFYDIKNKKDIIETMDDPVAKLYYSQHKLPEKINMEGLYKRQYDLERKDCTGRPDCMALVHVDECLRLPTLGQERSLFESDLQRREQKGGGSISFEDRYRTNVTGNEEIEEDPDSSLHDCQPCKKPCQGRGSAMKVRSLHVPAKTLEATPGWLFGTYGPHLDSTGKHSFKAAPYCHDSPVIECEANAQPVLGDHLVPTCADGCPSCMPCDIGEVPTDFCGPLTDTVIKNDFYRECRKRETREVDQKPIKCAKKTIVQPHYVKNYPKYLVTRKNLAMKNPVPSE